MRAANVGAGNISKFRVPSCWYSSATILNTEKYPKFYCVISGRPANADFEKRPPPFHIKGFEIACGVSDGKKVG